MKIVNLRRRRRRDGAAAVEMAIVLPVLIMIVMGTIESSRMGMVSQLLHQAARDGCRTAVLPGQTQAAVEGRIGAVLEGSQIEPTIAITSQTSPWTSAAAPAWIRVELSVPFDEVSWLGNPFAFNGSTIRASATLSSERDR